MFGRRLGVRREDGAHRWDVGPSRCDGARPGDLVATVTYGWSTRITGLGERGLQEIPADEYRLEALES